MSVALPQGMDIPADFSATPFPGMVIVQVRWAQTQLRAAGRTVTVDGIFGPQTAAALAEYAGAASAPAVVMPMPSGDRSRIAIMPELQRALTTLSARIARGGSATQNAIQDAASGTALAVGTVAGNAIAVAIGLGLGLIGARAWRRLR